MNTWAWQGGTCRADRPFLGAIADDYQDLRPGYGDDLVESVLRYRGALSGGVVEIGAGTGKATDAFLRFIDRVECVEPDREMARLLRHRYPLGRVVIHDRPFEEWRGPNRASLIYSAQAWHWLDPQTRCARAFQTLQPGGTLALFGHRFLLADPAVESRVDAVYEQLAPDLVGDKTRRHASARQYWYGTELASSGLFVDIESRDFGRVVSYDVSRYLDLVATFSSHRALPAAELHALISGLRDALQYEQVQVELGTVLSLGRRPTH